MSSQLVMIKVKQDMNLAKLMLSLVNSSPSSSIAIVWGQSSVLTTGLLLTLAPDFTFPFFLD